MIYNYLKHHLKMEYQNITNFLGNIPGKVLRFVTKMDRSL